MYENQRFEFSAQGQCCCDSPTKKKTPTYPVIAQSLLKETPAEIDVLIFKQQYLTKNL